MKGIIVIDVKKCLGCKTCEIECAIFHSFSKDLIGAVKERSLPKLKVEKISDFSVPIQCAHCDSPYCVSICPTNAIKKFEETGSVVIDEKLCIGCKSCIIVCPYGIPKISRNGKAIIKCDLCFENLEKSEEPVCVLSCPVKAIKFCEVV